MKILDAVCEHLFTSMQNSLHFSALLILERKPFLLLKLFQCFACQPEKWAVLYLDVLARGIVSCLRVQPLTVALESSCNFWGPHTLCFTLGSQQRRRLSVLSQRKRLFPSVPAVRKVHFYATSTSRDHDDAQVFHIWGRNPTHFRGFGTQPSTSDSFSCFFLLLFFSFFLLPSSSSSPRGTAGVVVL